MRFRNSFLSMESVVLFVFLSSLPLFLFSSFLLFLRSVLLDLLILVNNGILYELTLACRLLEGFWK
jgi:hypothetical protein